MCAGRNLFLCALLICLQGCGALQTRPDPFERQLVFPAPVEEIEKAVRELLEGTQVRAASSGTLRTGWVEGVSGRRFGLMGGSWRRRFRLTIQLNPVGQGTQVSVRVQVEEKAPGGRLGLRWLRTASNGEIEKEFLDKLKQRLEPDAP